VQSFLTKHADKISAVLSCFDRVILRGYLPFSYPRALEGFLNHHGILLKDFKTFAPALADRLKAHAQTVAAKAGRPYRHLAHRTRKDDLARQLAEQDGVRQGLICVLSCLETCRTFRVAYGQGRPVLKADYRRCLVLYYYFLDPQFGLLHLKLQTWFPFTLQVYVNGHDWLARKLDRAGIGYQQLDNAFVSLADAATAQRYAKQFWRQDWPKLLHRFARQINPLFGDLLRDVEYYWVIDQAEFATDVLFKDRAALQSLYPRLLQHATLCFSAEDVLRFLGRKLTAGFAGEVLNECKKRWPGARVKHRMKENWLKMYDKHGVVLRIETVINRPYEFKVRRWATRHGRQVLGWFPLTKGVGNLWRYAEVSLQANGRYLEALAVVDDAPRRRQVEKVSEPVRCGSRRRRGLNLLSRAEQELFRAVLRGEHAIKGFRNRDVAEQLYAQPAKTAAERRQRSARISRALALLRAHGLIAKFPRARRYRVTEKGQRLMSMAMQWHEKCRPQTTARAS
jgi:hypothetical protein